MAQARYFDDFFVDPGQEGAVDLRNAFSQGRIVDFGHGFAGRANREETDMRLWLAGFADVTAGHKCVERFKAVHQALMAELLKRAVDGGRGVQALGRKFGKDRVGR